MSSYELVKVLTYAAVGIYVVINIDSLIDKLSRIADALEKLVEEPE